MKKPLIFIFLLLPSLSFAHEFNFELGQYGFSRNEISIPGDEGTRFRVEDWKQQDNVAYRLYYSYQLDDKSKLRLLYAPLQTSFNGNLKKDVNFNGQLFSKGDADLNFKFNSYRLSYIRAIVKQSKLIMNIGGVLKVRDAFIELKQGNISSKRSDLGVVPLIHFSARYFLNEHTFINLDSEGLWAPQGRAIDASLTVGQNINNNLSLYAGLRTVEGGAENDKVYTYSMINQFMFGASYLF